VSFAPHPLDVLKEFPAPSPCDTVTVSPAAGMDMCLLRVWNDEGEVAMEVHLPARHASLTAQSRMLEFVRAWDSSAAPLSISPGPQLVPRSSR
jgi:hypothetical protein